MSVITSELRTSAKIIIPALIRFIVPEKAKIATMISERNVITVWTARDILIADEYAIADEKVSKKDALVPSWISFAGARALSLLI